MPSVNKADDDSALTAKSRLAGPNKFVDVPQITLR